MNKTHSLDTFNNKVLLGTIFVVLTILTSSIISFSNDLKFLLMSGICTYFFIQFFLSSKNIRLALIDASWILFVLICALSQIWAIDSSLVYNQLFGWILMFSWVILIRNIYSSKNYESIVHQYLRGLAFMFTAVILFASITGVSTDAKWVQVLGNNGNYISSYIIGLLPFVIFLPEKEHMTRLKSVLIAAFVISTLLIINITSTRAVLIALVTALIVKFFLDRQRRLLFTVGLIVSLVLMITINIPAESLLSQKLDLNILSDIRRTDDQSRYHLLSSSLALFQENPWFGIGSGNWHLEVYKYNLTDVNPFNSSSRLRHLSHNLYTTLLAEVGAFGFLTLFGPIVYILYYSFRKRSRLNQIEKAFLVSILAYLITSCFYGTTNFRDSHFSTLQFIAFTGLGILTSPIKGPINFDIKNIAIVLISCTSLIWFSYNAITNKLIYDAKSEIKKGSINKGLKKLASIYNPWFRTSQNTSESLSYILAKKYWQLDSISRASEYFEEAILKSPHNASLLFDYASFQYYEKKDYILSSSILAKLNSINSEDKLAHMLKSQIHLESDQFLEARKSLNKAYHPWYKYEVNLIEQALYQTKYLTEHLAIKTRLIEELSKFTPKKNLNKMRLQKWREINGPIVRSIYNYEFAIYKSLTHDEYEIYLNDRLSGRFKREITKVKKDFSPDLTSSDVTDQIFLEYGIEMERLTMMQKIKTDKLTSQDIRARKERLQQVLLDQLAEHSVLRTREPLSESLSNYNFGKFLFCLEQ